MPKQIVIIDNMEAFCKVLKAEVENQAARRTPSVDITCVIYISYTEALAHIEDRCPSFAEADLVVADVMMPRSPLEAEEGEECRGLRLLRAVRRVFEDKPKTMAMSNVAASAKRLDPVYFDFDPVDAREVESKENVGKLATAILDKLGCQVEN